MGAYAGPDVSENGLVLALDGANYKSFKGEATTNEIVSVTWWGDGSNQSSFVKGSVLITDENLKYNGYETYLWSPGTSNNCYLNGGDLSTGRTSTVWTFSCYIKRQDGAPITSLNVYMYYPSGDGSATGTIQDVGNGWYRVSRTRTGTNNYLSLIGFTGFVTGYKYYLSGAQLEKKSYPTTVVATNATRGTTVATGGGWADLTGNGNHGALVNGVRESSDNLGALVFDGTDDKISVNASSFTNLSNGNFTISSWFYIPTSVDTTNLYYWIFAIGTSSGASNTWYLRVWRSGIAAGCLFTRINDIVLLGTDGDLNASYPGDYYKASGRWTHFTFVENNGTSYYYMNGVQTGSASTPTIPSGNNYITIGDMSTDQSPNGMIVSNFSLYQKALTPSEIQQNFNATRGRFDI